MLLSSIGSRPGLAGVVVCGLFWLPLYLLGSDPSSEELDESGVVKLAESKLQAGQAKSAEGIIRTALAEQDGAALHRTLGDCLEAQGQYKQAAEEYRNAATVDPSEENLFAFGSELLRYHGYPQGLQIFSYAAAHFPDSARVLVGLGIAQYSLGQYEKAVETLCRAVDLEPADTRALDFLGKMTGVSPALSSKVQERLRRFATLYPTNASALYFYALSLLCPDAGRQIESTSEAKALLQRAVVLQPTFADAHYQLGVLYEGQRQPKEAAAEYLQAVKLQPQFKAAHYRLAQLYKQEGQSGLAQQQFDLVKGLPSR